MAIIEGNKIELNFAGLGLLEIPMITDAFTSQKGTIKASSEILMDSTGQALQYVHADPTGSPQIKVMINFRESSTIANYLQKLDNPRILGTITIFRYGMDKQEVFQKMAIEQRYERKGTSLDCSVTFIRVDN